MHHRWTTVTGSRFGRAWFVLGFTLVLCWLPPLGKPAWAQGTGTVRGVVANADLGTPVAQALVEVEGTSLRAITDAEGRFLLRAVPVGPQVLIVERFRTGGQRVAVQVLADREITVSVPFRPVVISLAEITVTGASRVPQRVVDAPAAIDVVNRQQSDNYSSTGQYPQVVKGLPGMDVAPNGAHDFNVNARGFNADLSERLLVLLDGRDLAIPFLAAQEWSALSLPLEDAERIEVVRGPGSALYGANAYNGVISIITPAARDIQGTKLSVAGGELGTLRGDVRHAGVAGPDDRIGYRVNLGVYRSDDWHRSRTNIGDLENEYAAAVDLSDYPVTPPPPGFEARALNGQTKQGGPLEPAVVTGDPDAVVNAYGSARVDYYDPSGAVGTVEGGVARVSNQVFMTNVGRFQVDHAWRPWARAAWAADRFYVTAWYSGRNSDQYSLASAAPVFEVSSLLHGEAQWNDRFFNDRARVVLGTSYRRSLIDSEGTLVAPADDNRSDWYAAGFAQLELELSPRLTLVGAGRFDESNLFEWQFSPKAALVYSPLEGHSFRVSAGQAFQTPRMTNFFLRVPLGLPADLTALENAMRGAFGPALDNVPEGTLFSKSDSVPALGLGNADLDVEKLTSYEVGYKGQFGERLFVTVDAFYARVRDFVSALLPAANPSFAPWTAPAGVDPAAREALEQAVIQALASQDPASAAGFTRLNDAAGTTAVVFSYGNAGRATEWGVEIGARLAVSPQFHLDANYTYFDFSIDSAFALVPGDLVIPNTPTHKGNLRVAYTGAQGLDAWASLRVQDTYDWSSGFFKGRIPPNQIVDVGVGYRIDSRVRFHAVATNLFDQAVYHIYGGSIDRRRVIGGVTALF